MSSNLQLQYRAPNRCKLYTYLLPDITPQITNLSIYSSISGIYTIVYVNGTNFSSSGPTGYSTVSFGNFVNLPVTYFSAYNISFVIPINALSDNYSVQVINNLYPSPLYSNIINYMLT